MGESASDYFRRQAAFFELNEPRADWRARTVADVAYTLEALGASPDDFEALLRLADEVMPGRIPAGLAGPRGYRTGLRPMSDTVGGEPVGVYCGLVVLVWVVGLG